MLKLGNNIIMLSENEKKEIELIKKLYEMGIEKLIYNEANAEMSMSFSAWTVDKFFHEDKFIGLIQGTTAQFIYDIVCEDIADGVETFQMSLLIDIMEKTPDEQITAEEILDSFWKQGSSSIKLEWVNNRYFVYEVYGIGNVIELNPLYSALVYEKLKNVYNGTNISIKIEEAINVCKKY